MKKQTLFSIAAGIALAFSLNKIGYTVINWEWWAITVICSILFSYLYRSCED